MNIETEIAIQSVKEGNKRYYLKAYEFAEEWVRIVFKPFSSEDLKEAFYQSGHEPPEEPRVFGAVINELKNNGLIFFHSYQKYKSRLGHSRPSTVWISLDYRLKQQNNSLGPKKAQTKLNI